MFNRRILIAAVAAAARPVDTLAAMNPKTIDVSMAPAHFSSGSCSAVALWYCRSWVERPYLKEVRQRLT